MKSVILLLLLGAMGLSACAANPQAASRWNPGTLTSLKEGSVISVELEFRGVMRAGGEYLIRGHNPTTNESFSGSYVVVNDQPATTAVITNAWGVQTGTIRSGESTHAIVSILKGDKGTVINLKIRLCNVGQTCIGEASDNQGVQYQVRYVNRQ